MTLGRGFETNCNDAVYILQCRPCNFFWCMVKAKEGVVRIEGVVTKLLRDAVFIVKLNDGCEVMAHASGRIRKSKIRILMHDRVMVEVSSYGVSKDGMGKGRVVSRLRNREC
ncbi:translation initiation factor IF-1 (infA) [Anaplasma marginale str. Florida]|uniref:Translation initiation factor IF-1 n=2 Tax=Anaplasma TaxID=768 RepID=B9KIX2_ANAMF|nr:translation initiation factor IF-1 [Anaplasma marginale]ACM49434.1 translation initiation factor IF-1 (infA) [Anaplasma marginale str. Florida]